jgi:hypothetical protein
VVRKSKNDAAGSDKIRKSKPVGKTTSVKAKKARQPKKRAVTKTERTVALVAPPAFDLSDDQISMRAYFISERRRRFDLPGDANSDWLEAKRQLLAETTKH